MIAIIDYGMGNLGSVSNACDFLELESRIVTQPDELEECDAIILPGVGAFGDCMKNLSNHGFVPVVREWIRAGHPFFGICLGLQALYEGSEESPEAKGLGILPGVVRRFDAAKVDKIPQIGWNQVKQVRSEVPLFRGIPDESYFYFVHSYFAERSSDDLVAGTTEYGRVYTSAVCRENLMAVQFHPEKSQRMGLQMLKNFAAYFAEKRVAE